MVVIRFYRSTRMLLSVSFLIISKILTACALSVGASLASMSPHLDKIREVLNNVDELTLVTEWSL